MVRKVDYSLWTEQEVHAELVYAECLLLKVSLLLLLLLLKVHFLLLLLLPLLQAMLTVCEDETLVSFMKAGLKVRQCYVSFK